MTARTPKPGSRAQKLWPALLIAALAAVLLPSNAIAGVAFLSGPLTNAPGGLRYDGDPNANNIAQIGWTGPAAVPGQEPRFYAQEHRPPQGAGITARTPCQLAGPAPAPFGHQDRVLCPVTFNGQAISSYTARLRGGSNNTLLIYNPIRIQGPLTNGYAEGGPGNDKIESLGATSADRLFGKEGDDILRITGGHPFYPNGVHNLLRGGPGSDQLVAFENGQKDRIFCDSGSNDHAKVDLQDQVADPHNCRTIERAPSDQHPVVKVAGRALQVRSGGVAVRLRCPRQATSDCVGRLAILRGTRGNRTLGRARYRIERGSGTTVRTPLRGSTRGTVRAVARESDPDGRPKEATVQLRVR